MTLKKCVLLQYNELQDFKYEILHFNCLIILLVTFLKHIK